MEMSDLISPADVMIDVRLANKSLTRLTGRWLISCSCFYYLRRRRTDSSARSLLSRGR